MTFRKKVNQIVWMAACVAVIFLFLLLSSSGVTADGDGGATPLPDAVSTTGSKMPLAYPDPPTEFFNPIVSHTAESSSLIRLDEFRADGRFSSIDGKNSAVVIMDTGIDLDHPFFGPDQNSDNISDRIVYQYDFGDDDGDASDINGHGSNVTSIALSSDSTYTGIAPGADIIHLKVFTDLGGGNFSYVEEALQWVLANSLSYNIVAVNMSLGDNLNHASEQALYGISDEIDALKLLDVSVVASSGNDFYTFSSAQGVGYPAADGDTIAVGAVFDSNIGSVSYGSGAEAYSTGADLVTPFSQRHASLSTIFAPGAAIVGAGPTGGLTSMHGTSQAAPHIAGIVALMQELAMRELGRKLTVAELEMLMTSTAVSINDGDDESDNVTNTAVTFSRVDVMGMAEAIMGMSVFVPPSVEQVNSNAGEMDNGFSTNADFAEVTITFSEDVVDPAGNSDPEDVTNPSNYGLFNAGTNGEIETSQCGTPQGDDTAVAIDSVIYESSVYTATIAFNGGAPLSEAAFRFFVCQEIEDDDGNNLDGNDDGNGGDDFRLDFEVDKTAVNPNNINFNGLQNSSITAPTSTIEMTFPDEMRYDPSSRPSPQSATSSGEVNNTANYRLFSAGANETVETSSCSGGTGDDESITINNAAYDQASRIATLTVNGGNSLPNDAYRLLLCSTLQDSAGNPLGSDFEVSFVVNVLDIFLPFVQR